MVSEFAITIRVRTDRRSPPTDGPSIPRSFPSREYCERLEGSTEPTFSSTTSRLGAYPHSLRSWQVARTSPKPSPTSACQLPHPTGPCDQHRLTRTHTEESAQAVSPASKDVLSEIGLLDEPDKSTPISREPASSLMPDRDCPLSLSERP